MLIRDYKEGDEIIMRVKKKRLIEHSTRVLKCKELTQIQCFTNTIHHKTTFISKKLLAMILALSTFSIPFVSTPVYANSDVTAESSGDVDEDEGQEPNPTRCSGSVNYSDTSILDEGDGNLVCAQSNGTWTTVTGNETPTSYHWVAWYKDKLKNDADVKDEDGNYSGFSEAKVTAWQPYEEEVKELNDGAYPEVKNYYYPTDTTTGNLDFWTDIAGYYTVMGDPKYENIQLTAYEQVVYSKEYKEEETIELASDAEGDVFDKNTGTISNPLENGDGLSMPPEVYSNSNGTSKDQTSILVYQTGWSGYRQCKGKDKNCKVTERQWVKLTGNQYTRITQKHDTRGFTSVKVERSTDGIHWKTDTANNGKNYTYHPFTDYKKGDKSNDRYDASSYDKKKKDFTHQYVGDDKALSNTWNSTYFDIVDEEKVPGEITYDSTNKTATRTYTTTKYYYKNVEVAKASIDSVYATELSQLKNLHLVKGTGNDVQLKTSKSSDYFWGNVTPSYWGNDGVVTLKNDSTMPYHFDSVGAYSDDDEDEDETTSLYSIVKEVDKEFTFTHGFSNIKDTDLDSRQYPSEVEENCAKTQTSTGKEKMVCSKKQTPLIKFKLNIDENNPQEEVDDEEIEKSITLTKDNDKEDSTSKDSSSTNSN